MGKKISAKALASLYPSTQWRTRNVISSAVTKVQKAYDEEFQRIQSLQQTYQSVVNFTNIAGEAYGSFRKAKMAGYEGNMFKYGTESSEIQGVWLDKYKTFNKQVMDESDNKLTLDKLYKKLKKTDKSNTVKNLAEQFKVSTEVTGKDEKTTSSGISDLIAYYNEGGKPSATEPSATEPKKKGLLNLFKGKSEEKFIKFGNNPRTGKQDKYRLDEDGNKIWESDVVEEEESGGIKGLFGKKNKYPLKGEFNRIANNPETGEQEYYKLDKDGNKIWKSDVEEEVEEVEEEPTEEPVEELAKEPSEEPVEEGEVEEEPTEEPSRPETLPTEEDDYSFDEEEAPTEDEETEQVLTTSIEGRDGKMYDIPYDVAQTYKGRKRYAKYLTYKRDEEAKGNEIKSWEDFDKDKDWKNVKFSSIVKEIENKISKVAGDIAKEVGGLKGKLGLGKKEEVPTGEVPTEETPVEEGGIKGKLGADEEEVPVEEEESGLAAIQKTTESMLKRKEEDLEANTINVEGIRKILRLDEGEIVYDADGNEFDLSQFIGLKRIPGELVYYDKNGNKTTRLTSGNFISSEEELDAGKEYIKEERRQNLLTDDERMEEYDRLYGSGRSGGSKVSSILEDRPEAGTPEWKEWYEENKDEIEEEIKRLKQGQQENIEEPSVEPPVGKDESSLPAKTNLENLYSQDENKYWENQSNLFSKKDYNFESPDDKLAFMDDTMNMPMQDRVNALNTTGEEFPPLDEMYGTIDDAGKIVKNSKFKLSDFWNKGGTV